MAGDSHTHFNHDAFTVGAVGGASTIAAALVNGVRNAAAAGRGYATVSGRDEMIRSMQRRVDAQRVRLARQDETIRDQAATISELRVRLAAAQYLWQRGR